MRSGTLGLIFRFSLAIFYSDLFVCVLRIVGRSYMVYLISNNCWALSASVHTTHRRIVMKSARRVGGTHNQWYGKVYCHQLALLTTYKLKNEKRIVGEGENALFFSAFPFFSGREIGKTLRKRGKAKLFCFANLQPGILCPKPGIGC